MNNQQVMQIMTEMGLHEGGMDNWVADNAWVKFANTVAAHEREACAKVCAMMEWRGRSDEAIWKGDAADECAAAIRARGEK